MYHPQQGKRQDQGVRRSVRSPERRGYVGAALVVVTVVFWVAGLVFVALMALYSFTGGVGTASSWATGISLSLVAVSSGVITWVEFRKNPADDAERGEWTNKALFYGLVCVNTWKVRRSPQSGKPVVVLNHVDHMRYVEGYAPSESKHQVDPHVGREM